MRVLLAAGGTGGHINPALAIAGYIRKMEPDAKILFAGTPKGMEARLVKQAGYDFAPVQVSGFMRKVSVGGIIHNVKTLSHIVTANFVSRSMIKKFKPDLVIGCGGYVSGPVVMAAARLGVKTMIHEQNAFPGVTNKLLAKRADRVLLAVGEAQKHFPSTAKCDVVGNPIRESIIMQTKKDAREKLGIREGEICVLSFGGSLGARILNTAGADLIAWNYQKNKIHHIHGYSKAGTEEFSEMLRKRGVSLESLKKGADPNIEVREYINEMGLYLAAADLLISRAGAMTLSELEACGVASILIPSPYVAENHQFHNAMVLVNHGAASVIEEKNYNSEEFVKLVESLCQDRKKLNDFGKNASKLAILDTTERIYHIAKEVLGENPG